MPKKPTKKPSNTPSETTRLPITERDAVGVPMGPPERAMLYPTPEAVYHVGENALEEHEAKDLLGWKYEDELDDWEKTHRHLFVDLHKKKVWCVNNFCNRPFSRPNAEQVKQEILRKKWKFNHESMIIGNTGKTLSAQHRLIGLVLACQEVELYPDKWDTWEHEVPTLDILISYGCDEDDETVNTIDTGRPRSLSDVIYRSEYFAAFTERDRKMVSRMCEHTVKMVWFRTGAGADAFAPKRTHAEALDFIERHPMLLKVVKHVYEENTENQIGQYLTPGYAAGIMYLMSVCSSDLNAYKLNPDERSLSWDYEDKALEFWTLIGAKHESMSTFHRAMVDLASGSRDVRLALICTAWNLFVAGKKMTAKNLELNLVEDLNGFMKLSDCPTVGGIDQGSTTEASPSSDPTELEIEDRVAAIRETKVIKPEQTKTEGKFELGDEVWIIEHDLETSWKGIVSVRPVPGSVDVRVKVANGFAGAGTEYNVQAGRLQHKSPFDH